MAIIARVSRHDITAQMEPSIRVQFFDDNDPANAGVGGGGEPGAVLREDVWAFPATMSGPEVQAALAQQIRDRGAQFVRAYKASAAAKQMVPVGALVNVDGV